MYSKAVIYEWPWSQNCAECEHGELMTSGSSRYACTANCDRNDGETCPAKIMKPDTDDDPTTAKLKDLMKTAAKDKLEKIKDEEEMICPTCGSFDVKSSHIEHDQPGAPSIYECGDCEHSAPAEDFLGNDPE